MKLDLIKTMDHTALHFAISHDKTKFATSSDRMVRVYSWPELEVIEKFRIGNVSSMVFLEDDQSILLLNTSGRLFLWDGEVLNKLGKWPAANWAEEPLVYLQDNIVVCCGMDGVWKYNVNSREIKKIYSAESAAYDNYTICGCDCGRIRVVCGCYSGEVEQSLEFVEIDDEGNVLEISTTEIMKLRGFETPAWNTENVIAISMSEPRQKVIGLRKPKHSIFLFSRDGKIITREELAEDEFGDIFYGGSMFALRCILKECIVFYDDASLKEKCRLNKNFFCAEIGYNCPETIAFMTDEDILVGSLAKMYVLRIEK